MLKDRSVDYAKGFAIFAIVLFHLFFLYLKVPQILKVASGFGGAGVHVFLICSGFGLYYSHLMHPLSLDSFLVKRLKKIYIPYIVVIFVSFLIPFMYLGSDRVVALLSHIFLFKMFFPSFEDSFGVQMWFISTIIQFYLVFIPLCYLKKKTGTTAFILISATLSIIWAIVTISIGKADSRVWGSFFLQYLWEFSIGMCLGEYFRNYHREFNKNFSIKSIIVILAFSFIVYAVMSLVGGPLKAFNDLFSALAFGSLTLAMYRIKLLTRFFLWVNTFSYELFLVHILVFTVMFRAFESIIPNVVIGILSVVSAFIVSIGMKKVRL